MIEKYRKKPVIIETIKWTGKNLLEIITFIDGKKPDIKSRVSSGKWEDYESIVSKKGLIIKTLEGQHIASIGDYIIKGIKGEFYPCKPDIFKKTYEKVSQVK